MATLHVAEFTGLAFTAQSDSVPILPVPPIAEQAVTVSASGVVIGAAFNPLTQYVELCTDSTCSVAWGVFSALTTATVTTGNGRLAVNERLTRQVPKGASFGLVAIAST